MKTISAFYGKLPKKTQEIFSFDSAKQIKKQTKHYENPLVICWLHGL